MSSKEAAEKALDYLHDRTLVRSDVNPDALDTVRAYIRELEARTSAVLESQDPQWIPVEERLPEREPGCVSFPDVLVIQDSGRCRVAAYDGNGGWKLDIQSPPDVWVDRYDPVTHWMPLPPSPPPAVTFPLAPPRRLPETEP